METPTPGRKAEPMETRTADERTRAFSGAPWEGPIGYCRALRIGAQIFVTGTAPVTDEGAVHAPGDAYAQSVRCLDLIERALASLGGELRHVVRTRMYVTDMGRWRDVGRAHGERFGAHPPCTTLVEVRALIEPEMLVEIEADAVLD